MGFDKKTCSLPVNQASILSAFVNELQCLFFIRQQTQ